jgi:hypothetical protein
MNEATILSPPAIESPIVAQSTQQYHAKNVVAENTYRPRTLWRCDGVFDCIQKLASTEAAYIALGMTITRATTPRTRKSRSRHSLCMRSTWLGAPQTLPCVLSRCLSTASIGPLGFAHGLYLLILSRTRYHLTSEITRLA